MEGHCGYCGAGLPTTGVCGNCHGWGWGRCWSTPYPIYYPTFQPQAFSSYPEAPVAAENIPIPRIKALLKLSELLEAVRKTLSDGEHSPFHGARMDEIETLLNEEAIQDWKKAMKDLGL